MFKKKPPPAKHHPKPKVIIPDPPELDPEPADEPFQTDPLARDLLQKIHEELGAFLAGGSMGAVAQQLAEDIKKFLEET